MYIYIHIYIYIYTYIYTYIYICIPVTIKPNNSCSRSTAPALSPQQQCAKYVSVVRGKGEGWHQHRPFAKKSSELSSFPFATIETNAFLCELCLQRICTRSTLLKGKMEKIWLAPPRPHELYVPWFPPFLGSGPLPNLPRCCNSPGISGESLRSPEQGMGSIHSKTEWGEIACPAWGLNKQKLKILTTTAKHGVYQKNMWVSHQGHQTPRVKGWEPKNHCRGSISNGIIAEKWSHTGILRGKPLLNWFNLTTQELNREPSEWYYYCPRGAGCANHMAAHSPQTCSFAQAAFVIKLCRIPISRTEMRWPLQHIADAYQDLSMVTGSYRFPMSINNQQQSTIIS